MSRTGAEQWQKNVTGDRYCLPSQPHREGWGRNPADVAEVTQTGTERVGLR